MHLEAVMADMKTEGSSALDFAAFRQYMSLTTNAGSNEETLKRMKAAVPVIIREDLTDCQRDYVMAYFYDGLNVREIGERYGVDKSTVSRTIRRGMARVYRLLRFSFPGMVESPRRNKYITNRDKRAG